jgi:plastocyanin
VSIQNSIFTPANPTIAVGGIVTWTNRDVDPHNVIAEDGHFHSDLLTQGQVFSRQFDRAGAFTYVCTLHGGMTGVVTVR